MRVGLYLLAGAGILTLNTILGFVFSFSSLALIIQNLIIDGIVFILSFVTFRHRPEKEKPKKLNKKIIILSVIGIVAIWFTSQASMRLIVGERDVIYESIFKSELTASPLFIAAFILTTAFTIIAAPVSEEFLYRGIFYHGLAKINVFKNKNIKIIFAIIMDACIFGIIHMNVIQMISALIMAAFICIIYQKTGAIWLCIALHSGFNTIGYTFNITGSDIPLGVPALIPAIIVSCITIILILRTKTIDKKENKNYNE